MILVDSHCHLDLLDSSSLNEGLDTVIAAAKAQHVAYLLSVSVTLDDLPRLLQHAETYPNVFASVGLHPNEAPPQVPSVNSLVKLAEHHRIIAIGETGLDYYRSEGDLDWQIDRFRAHIQAAKITKKSLIIHSRAAKEDTLRVLREEDAQDIGGVMHCFVEDWEMAQAAIALNFYISFSGIVTFNSAKDLQEVAKQVPLDRMLIETDSPYLAPVPKRGKPNVPANVYFVAEFIAKLRDCSVEEIAEATTHNFFKCFPAATR